MHVENKGEDPVTSNHSENERLVMSNFVSRPFELWRFRIVYPRISRPCILRGVIGLKYDANGAKKLARFLHKVYSKPRDTYITPD